ncbi:Polyketide synthase 2 [Frankliniella fusca]|uniref:Polyketide synthase 2 n=1 Tax=Frankliniella fusca TaxID=407009 RepID=A0AAE1LUJ1_9NEOP|nr:Polyketide synthase 2 [Frankliniella fusca]
MIIRLALHLHCISSAGYEYLRETGVLELPSSRRLFDYSHFIDAAEGCQGDILADIKKKIDICGSEDHFSYVSLMFDEMHIRSGIVTHKSTGEMVGFTNLSDTERQLEEIQTGLSNKKYTPRLAKKVLVYLAKGITSSKLKDVVAVYSTDDMTAVQLYNRTWEVISNSVANCIEELADKEMLQPHDTSELVKLIQLDWKKDIITRPGIYTDTEKSRMIISHQSLEAIIITVKGFNASTKYMLEMAQGPKVDARVFNQDPLEQYFGKVRRKQGDNKQPLEKQVLDTRLKLHQAEAAALAPSKGNTSEGRGRRLELENSPLLSRKKPKKN